MKNKLLSIAMLLLFAVVAIAQKDIEIDYKAFSKVPDVTKADVKKIKAADEVYYEGLQGSYKTALPLYLEIYSENLGYDPLDWRIAICYLHSENKPQAIKHILQCDVSVSKLYYFYLGKAYHFDGQFEKAKESYSLFADQILDADKKMFFSTFDVKANDYDFLEVMQELQDACDVGINNAAVDGSIEFENITIINSVNDELYPSLHPDGELVYSSNKSLIPNVDKSNFKIFGADCSSMLIIGFPILSSKYPQDDEDNLIAMPYSDASEGLLYQSMKSDGGDIMKTYTKGSKVKGEPISRINSSSKEGIACFVDDSVIVFSSDRASKTGENDLYIVRLNENGKWGKPTLVGGDVNSSANEEVATFYDGDLYFAANGKGSIGGYDIFKVSYLGNNSWGEVENLGYPINTADNDLGYFPVDDYNGFYCGVRPGGVGGVDIYKVMFDSSNFVDTTMVDTIIVDSINLDIMQEDSLIFVTDTLVMDSIPLILGDTLMVSDSAVDSSGIEEIIGVEEINTAEEADSSLVIE